MHPYVKLKLSSLFIVTYFVAICVSRNLPVFTLVLLLEPIGIWVIVSILMYGIPQRISCASQSNCYRMDGTKSDRRSALERRAMDEIWMNLLFVLAVLFLFGNWMFLVLDSWGWIEYLNSDNVTPKRLAAFRVAVLLWLIACFGLLYYFYRSLMQTLNAAISSRAKNYLALDIEEVQKQFERESAQRFVARAESELERPNQPPNP